MELIYILLFGIVVAAIQGFFGLVPTSEPEKEEDNSFSFFAEEDEEEERHKNEIDDEIFGVANHGHGFYDLK